MYMTTEDPRILELRRVRAKALEGGGEDRIKKQKAKGKLTARERIDLLLDPGTFNEIEPFITHSDDELNLLTETYYGDGVVTGHGQINGRTVYLYSQDFTIYGGTLSEMQSHKICRVMDLAVRNGVPFISLIDSGGAHPGRRTFDGRVRGNIQAQRPILWRRPPDRGHARTVRWRRGLLPGSAGPGHHGREDVLYVPDGPGSDQGCDRRSDRRRIPGRLGRTHVCQRCGAHEREN